jgi:thiosulfate dehydrogenase [quinone] large subunit
MATRSLKKNVIFSDPPIASTLFNSTTWAPLIWLVIRLYLAYQWISAGIEKLENPAWTQTGLALKGFWTAATALPKGNAHPAVAFSWYREFLSYMLNSGSYVWFAKLVVAGEILVGIALLLGLFTGIAAFLGGFMNWNFMMAGSASTNPMLFVLSVLLILAWKTAGWWGLDRFILPILGTPWQPGKAFDQSIQSPNR